MPQTASSDVSAQADDLAESGPLVDSRQPHRSAEGPTATFRRAAARARRKAALDDQKRSFLRMVSHELRTPLNAVIGFSEILASELYGPLGAPQYKEYAKLVHESGLKLLKLVNQIVEIARLEGHVTDLDVAAEPLDEAVEDVMAQLRGECQARGVMISAPELVGMPAVMADRRGLRTIVSNLLQNAVAHSPQGGVVMVEAVHAAGGMVEITIRDQGDGVEPGDLQRLLRPFEQAGSSLTRSGEGAGLGLPIVDLLTRAMNGGLRLKSTPGEGLTAIVTLPAA